MRPGTSPGPPGPVPPYEVVVVSYKSRGQLEQLLPAVPPEAMVVLVDNASGADRVGELLRDRPRARLLDGGGTGFARAANLGARTSSAPFLVFANPDSRPTREVWDALVAELAADPGLASCAATTTTADGSSELGVGGWEPSLRRTVVHGLGLHRLFPRAGLYARPRPGEDLRLDWLSGACLAVRREAFLAVGGFDESFFVYNEDMALGRRLRAAGWRQRLRTDLLVPHSAGGSGAGSTAMLQTRGASMARYLGQHDGPAHALAMRAVLALAALARVPLAAVRGQREWPGLHLAYARGVATGRRPEVNT